MTKPTLSAIRWIDLDASLANPCSWSRHSEFGLGRGIGERALTWAFLWALEDLNL
jgi:hypothetical protein